MPPGPRFTSLPFIGNMLSFDSGESFGEITVLLPVSLPPIKASLKQQKSPETTTDTQDMSKFY